MFLLKYYKCAPEKPYVLQKPTLKISGFMEKSKARSRIIKT